MKHPITGIILVGGKSRRMGKAKAFLLYQGKPLIVHIMAALEKVTTEIILVGGDASYDIFGKQRVADHFPDAGPLGGLYTGLYHSKTENNIVLGCDTPLVNEALLQLLVKEATENFDGIQLQSKGQKMPLIALYKKGCMLQCEIWLKAGKRRLQEAVALFNTKTIVVPHQLEDCTLNVNTPEDLKYLEDQSPL